VGGSRKPPKNCADQLNTLDEDPDDPAALIAQTARVTTWSASCRIPTCRLNRVDCDFDGSQLRPHAGGYTRFERCSFHDVDFYGWRWRCKPSSGGSRRPGCLRLGVAGCGQAAAPRRSRVALGGVE
jgi:hypothetical protein